MTGQVRARSGQVFTVADDDVQGWVDRGYTAVDAAPAEEAAPAEPEEKPAKKSAAKKSSTK